MLELLQALPQLAALIEKLGTVGVLLIAIAFLVYERLRLTKMLGRAYRARDKARLKAERYRSACAGASLAVDVSDIDSMFTDED